MSGHRGSKESPEISGDLRRARKRATDRRAQQHHRQRRKEYVKQLEDTVKKLSDRHSSEERIAALLDEQKRLRERCANLTKVLDNIRTLLAKDDLGIAADLTEDISGSSEHDIDAERRDLLQDERTEPWPADDGDRVAHLDRDEARDCYETLNMGLESDFCYHTQGFIDTTLLGGNHVPPMFPLGDGATINRVENNSITSTTGLVDLTCTAISSMAMAPHNDSSRVPTWTALSEEVPTQRPSALSLFPTSLAMFPASSSHLNFLNFPKCASPAGPGDTFLLNLLKEARQEHSSGMFTSDKPTLNRLLVDPPPDIVAYRLFQFITSYGAMPMHLLLATFWVQYLLLRWLVVGSREAYEMIPLFMRPSELECRTPHSLYISMLVWPHLREAMIRDNAPDPEAVGIAALESLQPKWSSTGMHGMLSGNDVIGTIEQQASTTAFWSLDDRFKQKYPCYADTGFPA